MTSTTEPIDLRRSRDFGEQVNVTVAFIRQNYRKLGRSVVSIAGATILANALVTFVLLIFPYLSFAAGGEGLEQMESTVTIAGTLLQFLLYGVVLIQIICAVNAYVMLYLEHGADGFGVEDVQRESKKKFWLIARTLLMLWLLTAFLLAFGKGWLASGGLIRLMMGVAMISVVARFIVRLIPIFSVMFHEQEAFSDAMDRCKELMENRWWFTFGLILLFYVLVIVMMLLLELPAYLILWSKEFDPYLGGEWLLTIPVVALSLLSSLVGTAGLALPVIAGTLHYFNLVEKTDGTGTMQRIDTIGAEPGAVNLETPVS